MRGAQELLAHPYCGMALGYLQACIQECVTCCCVLGAASHENRRTEQRITTTPRSVLPHVLSREVLCVVPGKACAIEIGD